jgi:hypothetical protein
MPSDTYFKMVKTKKNYNSFIASGMAWEVEPETPGCWSDHLELVKRRKENEES